MNNIDKLLSEYLNNKEVVLHQKQKEQESKHDHKAALNLIEQELREAGTDEGLATRITALVVVNDRLPLTSLLGQVQHITTNLDEVEECVMHLAENDWIDLLVGKSGQVVLINRLEFDDETTDRINHHYEFSYPLPMLRKPKIIKNNSDSAYLTQYHKVIAGNRLNQHDEDIHVGHLNRLNSNKFVLNTELMNKFNEQELMSDKAKDTIEKRQNVSEHLDECEKVYAEMEGKEFHFAHFKDTRNRFYNMGYHITYQGSQYKKASLHFAEKRVISK